jgi:hypothetical protein
MPPHRIIRQVNTRVLCADHYMMFDSDLNITDADCVATIRHMIGHEILGLHLDVMPKCDVFEEVMDVVVFAIPGTFSTGVDSIPYSQVSLINDNAK